MKPSPNQLTTDEEKELKTYAKIIKDYGAKKFVLTYHEVMEGEELVVWIAAIKLSENNWLVEVATDPVLATEKLVIRIKNEKGSEK
jgi:hypothetical protein